MPEPSVPKNKCNRGMDGGTSWITLWIYVGAWASASGWILSALGELNRPGYFLMLCLGILVLRRSISIHKLSRIRFAKLRKRFSRPLPATFAGLTMFVLIGGALYAPNNYDYLTYRFPRVLHWTAEHSWYWISTSNARMNYQAPGFEWLMAPLFVFFKTDRFFFLINFFSFCLIPGLTFSVFRRLGVSRHSSWIWMWLLPAGYCYVLQAGSVGNDSFSAVYLLASLHFAFLARETGKMRFLVLSWLAICLLTGAKLSNAPLCLPWLVLVFPLFSQLVKRLRALIPAGILGLLISFFPILILNSYYSGDWTGDPVNSRTLRISNPAIGIAGNFLQIVSGNLAPPVFPWASQWNQRLPKFSFLKNRFPKFSLKVGEIQIEEKAGIGFALTIFLLLFLALSLRRREVPRLQRYQKLFTAAVLVSTFTFISQFGPESAARLFAPYYVVLIALLMMHVTPDPGRDRLWFSAALIAALFAIPVLVFSPSRPLWPALTVMSTMKEKYPANQNVQRAFHVYSVYRNRADSLASLRSFLPENVKTVGMIQTGDDPESSLWIPFGSRKITEVLPGQRPCDLGITTVVIHTTASGLQYWLTENPGIILGKKRLTTKASIGHEDWYVVNMNCSRKKMEKVSLCPIH